MAWPRDSVRTDVVILACPAHVASERIGPSRSIGEVIVAIVGEQVSVDGGGFISQVFLGEVSDGTVTDIAPRNDRSGGHGQKNSRETHLQLC